MIRKVHHVAIIVSDLEKSLDFYCTGLGLRVIRKVFREERNSWKVDLALNDQYVLELFTFQESPARASRPEALGLRHLAFEVADLSAAIAQLETKNISCEPIRIDEFTGKKFTFTQNPDGLPIEFYEL